jgi:DNA-binding CsgD family transcriptional regulator/tetratricopeptide (TPR) repeat protein
MARMAARSSDVFVGRVRELVELERVLDATRTGSGSTVLVAGEAGIGKTRLATELARRARDAGFEVLLGRSIDLVGTELPYQPFVDAVRPLGESSRLDARTAGSQLQVFEESLALLVERATAAPVLLILEDLHWADASTLDLVVFLAHNLRDRPVLLLATYRADEPSSADRMHRLTEGVRRSGSALALELGPLPEEELAALLAARADDLLPAGLSDAIIGRCEGNPFFAEELLAAAYELDGELPPGLRTILLRRVGGLDASTLGLLRLAAAAGRDVGYPLLRAVAQVPEGEVRASLRQAVEHGLLVAEQVGGTFRFRHALLAEAVYATILPGEREELHGRLAEELARSLAASAAELAPHWAVAGRAREALVASVEAAEQAQAVFGLAEALAHLERVLALWDAVPDAHNLVKVDLAEVCSRAAGLANQVGAVNRAVELAQRAIGLVDDRDPHRAAVLHVLLGELQLDVCRDGGGVAETVRLCRHAVQIVPADPPSPERAYALGSLGGVLMVAWRHAESLPIGEEALRLAREVGAREAEVRALTVRGADRVYLGRVDEGLVDLRHALRLADEIGDHWGLDRVYVNLTDALTMLGRPAESARLGRAGLEVLHGYGIVSGVLTANTIEALLAIGDWTEADGLSAAALRRATVDFRHMFHMLRADLDVGRGDFDAARAHLDAVLATLPEDRHQGIYDVGRAELALWEHRWTDAVRAVRDGMAVAPSTHASLTVWLCAKGLRAQAELVAIARARRDADAVRDWCEQAGELIPVARHAARASATTPTVEGWLALAEAEHARALGAPSPELWSAAAAAWDLAERPPLAAYGRWREADALVTVGASRTEAGGPLRRAHAIAVRIGATPLLRELDLLAQRARLELAPPDLAPGPVNGTRPSQEFLGLTAREAEVLDLIARGCTNREIAAALVISVRTASVHVSRILHKLGVASRLEAAAIAHRLAAP